MRPLPPPSLDWCLFLDVDGTLLEFTDTPFETFADTELKSLLAEVSARLGGALALVSGRTIEYLDVLFSPLRLPAAGVHGVERRNAQGVMHGVEYTDSMLDPARAALRVLVTAHPGTVLEDKGRSVAVHFRMAPQFAAAIADAVGGIVSRLGGGYHIQGGNMMLEIKPTGFSKASAIAAFMQEAPFFGRMPVFAGDDLTDRDGFRAVEERGGISIAVGDRVHGQCRAANAAAVRAWLKEIAAFRDPQNQSA